MIEWNGKTASLRAHAEEAGLKPATVEYRLRMGWPVERAFTTPPIIGEARSALSRSLIEVAVERFGGRAAIAARVGAAQRDRYSDPERHPPAALAATERQTYEFLTRRKRLPMAEALRSLGRHDLADAAVAARKGGVA